MGECVRDGVGLLQSRVTRSARDCRFTATTMSGCTPKLIDSGTQKTAAQRQPRGEGESPHRTRAQRRAIGQLLSLPVSAPFTAVNQDQG